MISRYQKDTILSNPRRLATADAISRLRAAVISGAIQTNEHVLVEGQRLDQLAGSAFGDGTLWWVIAACSGIGWGLQVPPGTRCLIPRDIAIALNYI